MTDASAVMRPLEVHVPRQSPRRLIALLGEEPVEAAEARAIGLRDRLQSRVVWNINSTARGGGVAEMLQSLLPYARGMGVDARWLVIRGTEDFFRITKRLHHALHASEGDGSPLDDRARAVYESVLHDNATQLITTVRPGDVVILHDPQTAGLIPPLKRHGARVVWRCHVGTELNHEPDAETAWEFLARYVSESDINIFSHPAYIPLCCDGGRTVVIRPSIDPFSPKNEDISLELARNILVHTGIISGALPGEALTFTRLDGSPGRVDHLADVTSLGPPPPFNVPLIAQVSRWDPLKDPIGVMDGFAQYLETNDGKHSHLVLAGPNVRAIADDPEGAETLDLVVRHWRNLPHFVRSRILLACLPMADVEENAAIVNALQRHASIIVQKSIHEGFGLTVTEAMWKARPVVASAVGGIVDQIEDGANGILLRDPRDPAEFSRAVGRLMDDPGLAGRLGENARESVRQHYLPIRHLVQYADLFERLDL